MTPRLYHQVEKAFKQAYLAPLTFLRYGSTHPARAKLHGCDNWIYIDPNDPCALKKVVHEPLRGKVSTNLIFWRELVTHLQPHVAVDVGLNYGECLFGTNYPTSTRLFGFAERSTAGNPSTVPARAACFRKARREVAGEAEFMMGSLTRGAASR